MEVEVEVEAIDAVRNSMVAVFIEFCIGILLGHLVDL